VDSTRHNASREEDQVDASAPTFLTHRELDLFLGGGERGPKKRQRLRRENLLVGDLTRLDGAPECLSDLTRRALGLRVFSQLTKAVLVSVRAMDGWRFDQLIDDVGELAQPALAEWNACINAAESELHQRFGIAFSTAFGVIERVNSGICVVSLAEGGSQTFDADRVAAPVDKGRAVAIERVRVMDSEMNFVLPSTVDIPDAQDRELASWFSKMMAAPTAAPTPTFIGRQHR